MNPLKAKLDRLERTVTGGGMLAVVEGGNASEEAIHALARAAGVEPERRDNLVVVVRTFYEEQEGSIDHDNHPELRLLSVTKMKPAAA